MRELREQSPKRKSDYLKYWRSIYYYTAFKYDLTYSELDMLLYLYSEPYFTIKTFNEGNKVMQLGRHRLKNMIDKGLIDVFRKGGLKLASLYQLSRKGSTIVSTLYRQIDGGIIQEQNTKLYKKKGATYMQKRHAELILKRNEAIRQQQRPTHEE